MRRTGFDLERVMAGDSFEIRPVLGYPTLGAGVVQWRTLGDSAPLIRERGREFTAYLDRLPGVLGLLPC